MGKIKISVSILFLVLAFLGCSSKTVKSVPLTSVGQWDVSALESPEGIVLVPQWHYSPQTQTRDQKLNLPQDRNQNAIFEQISTWIQSQYIKSVVVEGCEGQLVSTPDVAYNGWSLNDLRDQKNLESAQTHVGLKILSRFKNAANVECGDDLNLIREHQLALSDIRGLAGFKMRIEQSNLSPQQRAQFISGLRDVLKLPKKSKEELIFKRLDQELKLSIERFEDLIRKRNKVFLTKAHALPGRKVIVIGALHIEDLMQNLKEQNIPFAVWRSVGLDDDGSDLIPSLKKHLRLPSSNQVDTLDIFEKFWTTAKSNIYPSSLANKFFTSDQYAKLHQQAQSSTNIVQLASHLNQFLTQLQVSHTRFYTDQDIEFHFFRSLFTTRNLDEPAIWHIGAEFSKTNTGYVVRAVLDGFPAQQAGLRRGDVVVNVNSLPFDPFLSFILADGSNMKMLVQRGRTKMNIGIAPVKGGLHRAYVDAIKSSVTEFSIKKKRIGYVHLWTGTHDQTVIELNQALERLKDTDGIILDLRDGYGGAWWSHLDPFYQDTSSYFKATWVDRDGNKTEMLPEAKQNKLSYSKPMIVLINEGVRSGKEALAFQFKKTKRATLLGTPTAGYFVGGGAYFREKELPYFLYLSSKGLLLDGVDLEGNGVNPDILVRWPIHSAKHFDPQLKKAKEIILQTPIK
jgi:carboxyl-terminal processing protease